MSLLVFVVAEQFAVGSARRLEWRLVYGGGGSLKTQSGCELVRDSLSNAVSSRRDEIS